MYKYIKGAEYILCFITYMQIAIKVVRPLMESPVTMHAPQWIPMLHVNHSLSLYVFTQRLLRYERWVSRKLINPLFPGT
jgi:hypothetical protein